MSEHRRHALRVAAVRGIDPRPGLLRVVSSLPAILQITAAALAAYVAGRFLLGHPTPFIAVAVAITSLGFVRDARPRRVLETAVAMTLGIAVSELIVIGLGQGPIQLVVVLLVTLAVARFLSPTAAFAVAAAIQSALVVLLPAPVDGVFARTLDAVVGGTVAVLATALIPRDPRRTERQDAAAVFGEVVAVLTTLSAVLRTPDAEESAEALLRARSIDRRVDRWRESLDSAVAIARISPFLRHHLRSLRAQEDVVRGTELAVRNLRSFARRVDVVTGDGRSRPRIAEVVATLAQGAALLAPAPRGEDRSAFARQTLILAALRLDPDRLVPDRQLVDVSLVLQMRPLAFDLLVASGLTVEDARRAAPPLR